MKTFVTLSLFAVVSVGCAEFTTQSSGDVDETRDYQQVATSGNFTFAGLADWDGDGNQDIVARENATGLLWLYPGESVRSYSGQAPVQIGNGWNGYTFAGLADWDGDGNQDIVVRENATGLLWLYPGESVRGYSSQDRVQIGNGWNGYTFAGLADWDHDGNQDIIVRENATGLLWLYPGESVRDYSNQGRVQIGNGWTGYTFAGLADWDGDGNQDIVVRQDATGLLWLYPGQSVRDYSSETPVQIGNGWTGYTFAGLADWDRDGNQDIVVRADATRLLWLYPGQSVRGYSNQARAQIGNGW
jgi:hypothetical protein